jgi:hypothetical protein
MPRRSETLGLGAVAPLVAGMAAEPGAGDAPGHALANLSLMRDILWPAVVAAVLLHIFAQILVFYLEPEKD